MRYNFLINYAFWKKIFDTISKYIKLNGFAIHNIENKVYRE